MLQDVLKPVTEQQFHRTERKRQKPNEARWKKEQTKDLLKAAEDARDKNRMAKEGEGGAEAGHIQRHFCVQIGLMSLCYKKFFLFLNRSGELNKVLSKYTCFERKVDIIQRILWYKNMNIYNHEPPLHTITPPRPHI